MWAWFTPVKRFIAKDSKRLIGMNKLASFAPRFGRHDVQHNGIKHNDIQHNDTRHEEIIFYNQHNGTRCNDTQDNNTLKICWMSLCWVSLCRVSWRQDFCPLASPVSLTSLQQTNKNHSGHSCDKHYKTFFPDLTRCRSVYNMLKLDCFLSLLNNQKLNKTLKP